MVALAPITNETPAWDVLDAFPKLHSRAREAKTTPCTEVPMHKSRNCIEIWLTIYETCDGLESFTRDPIGYADGKNLYLANFAMKGVDPSGTIKVTNAGGSLGGKNGDVGCKNLGSRDWHFELESPAPCEGYFVQRVVKICVIRDCENCDCAPLSKSRISTIEYWEAWSVTKGKKTKDPIPPTPDSWTDTASLSAPDDTCGVSSQAGEVRFYCKNANDLAANGVGTGDVSSDWVYDYTHGFGTECQSRAGRIYSTKSAPGFWENGAIETGNRIALLNWKCCKGGDKQWANFWAFP